MTLRIRPAMPSRPAVQVQRSFGSDGVPKGLDEVQDSTLRLILARIMEAFDVDFDLAKKIAASPRPAAEVIARHNG